MRRTIATSIVARPMLCLPSAPFARTFTLLYPSVCLSVSLSLSCITQVFPAFCTSSATSSPFASFASGFYDLLTLKLDQEQPFYSPDNNSLSRTRRVSPMQLKLFLREHLTSSSIHVACVLEKWLNFLMRWFLCLTEDFLLRKKIAICV